MDLMHIGFRTVALLQITRVDLALIMACCERHYDGRVKSAIKQGGFVYGWGNHFDPKDESTEVFATPDQIDLVQKALEIPSESLERDMANEMSGKLSKVREEMRRLERLQWLNLK